MKINKFYSLIITIGVLVIGMCGFSQERNALKIIKCNGDTNRCIVKSYNLKYGIADKSGKVLLPCEYSDIDETEYSNYLVTTKDNKMGLVDKDGVFLLKPIYLSIKKSAKAGKYAIQPNWDNLFGLADMKTGHIDILAEYDFILPLETGAYRVDRDEKMGIISSDFKLILPTEYYFINVFPGNIYYRLHKEVTYKNSEGLTDTKDVYGVLDLNGNFVLPVEYDWIDKNPSSYKQTVRKGSKNYLFNTQKGTLTAK